MKTKFILFLASLILVSFQVSGQKKYRQVSPSNLPDNVVLIKNTCPFEVKFHIIHEDDHETEEYLKSNEGSMFGLIDFGKIKILREKGKPGHEDLYRIFEGRVYQFEYDKKTDLVSVVEYIE